MEIITVQHMKECGLVLQGRIRDYVYLSLLCDPVKAEKVVDVVSG